TGRVPAPLMRVEARRRTRRVAEPVSVEDRHPRTRQRGILGEERGTVLSEPGLGQLPSSASTSRFVARVYQMNPCEVNGSRAEMLRADGTRAHARTGRF